MQKVPVCENICDIRILYVFTPLNALLAGTVKTISGQFKKSDLSTEHRLNARDLRKIDSRVPNLVPTILVRKEAILVNILHIRALVKADTVVLFDTYGSVDSRLHSVFLYHLEHNLKVKGSGLPYEFRALESIMLSVLSALEAEMVFIRNLVGGLLAELEDNIDHDRFKRLLHYSRRLTSFQNRAKLVEEALEEVLGQDEDMMAMYLTDKKKKALLESLTTTRILKFFWSPLRNKWRKSSMKPKIWRTMYNLHKKS